MLIIFFHGHNLTKNIKFKDPIWLSVTDPTNAATITNESGKLWNETNNGGSSINMILPSIDT